MLFCEYNKLFYPIFLFLALYFQKSYLYYSQRSHLARIKGRVNKGIMPFSRSSIAGRFSMAEPQFLQMQFQKRKPFYKMTHHQLSPAAQAQADEKSLEVCKVLFSLFLATCFVPVFMCLVCFCSTVLFYFVRPAFNVLPLFHVGFAGHFVISYVVCPALNVLHFLWALRAIFGLVCYSPCF